MSGSSTLNSANYSTVWSDNFGRDTKLNSSLFPVHWGNVHDFEFAHGALTLTSYASENWTNVGFLQADFGATSAQGYGLYSVMASANAGEANGIAITMWPSDNNWPGPEIDLLEDWTDPTRQTGYATIHWKGSDGSNQYDVHQFKLNLTRPHVFAMDWEPGSLTYYIDGRKLFQVTGSPEVPKDAAQGGVNESFGAEVTSAGSGAISSSVSLHLYSMSYAKFVGSAPITSRTVNGNTASFVSSGSATTPVAGIQATTPGGSGLGPDTPAISPDQHGITYTISHVDGVEVIKNFNPLLGDKLVLAAPLANEVQTLRTSSGSTLIFGDSAHRIDLPGAQIGAGDLLTM